MMRPIDGTVYVFTILESKFTTDLPKSQYNEHVRRDRANCVRPGRNCDVDRVAFEMQACDRV